MLVKRVFLVVMGAALIFVAADGVTAAVSAQALGFLAVKAAVAALGAWALFRGVVQAR